MAPAARELLKPRWQKERLHVVSGKALLTHLSTWSQETYGVALGAMAITKAFHASEIPAELRQVITNIEEGMPFS